MGSRRRMSLGIALVVAVAGFAFLIGRLARDEAPETATTPVKPATAAAPALPTAVELPVPSSPAAAAPAEILKIARFTVKLTGVPEPLNLDPPLQAALDPAPLDPQDTEHHVVTKNPSGGAQMTVDLDPGKWLVQMGTLDARLVHDELTLSAGPCEHVVDATKYGGLQGRVVDERGKPIADATVEIALYENTHMFGGGKSGKASTPSVAGTGDHLTATTRADGSFTLPLLPADKFLVLDASAPGRLMAHRDPFGLGGMRIEHMPDIVLAKGRTISGHVLTEAGAPVRCELLCLIKGFRAINAATDEAGAFRFENLPELSTQVVTTSSTGKVIAAGQQVDQPGDVDLTLVTHTGVWVEGTLSYEDGKPAAGLRLMGYRTGGDASARVGEDFSGGRSAEVSDDGHFKLGPFSPGAVHVWEPMKTGLIANIVAPSVVQLVAPGQRTWDVTLRFRDAQNSEPITATGSGRVIQGGESSSSSSELNAVTPNAGGEWHFQRQTASQMPVTLTILFPGCESAKVGPLSELTDAGPVDVAVRRERSTLVRVLNPDGQPVTGARVNLMTATDKAGVREVNMSPRKGVSQSNLRPFPDQLALSQTAETDAAGEVRFTRLGDGPFAWMISAAGFVPVSDQTAQFAAPTAGQPDLVITLQPAVRVAAR